MNRVRVSTLTAMIVCASVARVLPHPPNFSPIAAMALFGGATFGRKWLALATTLAALFLSDCLLELTIRGGLQTGWLAASASHGFYQGMWVVYACFALTVTLGFWLRSRLTVPRLALATLTSAVLFFGVTNFVFWYGGTLYPRDLHGLIASYIAAIPFFGRTLAGDAVYVSALFGALALAESRWPGLRETPADRLALGTAAGPLTAG